ncbi:hypothetical protein JCM14469_18420 [Desulfatiferula olefinivorans]
MQITRRWTEAVIIGLLAMLMLIPPSFAEVSPGHDWSLALIFENDSFAGTDIGYTNGVFMTCSSGWRDDGTLPEEDLIHALSRPLARTLSGAIEFRKCFSFGQTMITPSDIERPVPDPEDLPYVGLLFGRFGVEYQNTTRATAATLLLGVIGPSSQADKTQKAIHKMIGVQKPMGWHYQLDDEPAVNLHLEHKWKAADDLARPALWPPGYDLTAYAGLDAGNIMSDVRLGGILRLGNGGSRFPASVYKGGIGSTPDINISTGSTLVVNALAGVEVSYVFNSIILDGNTVGGVEPELDRVPLTADLFWGMGLGFRRWWFSMVMVRGTNMHEAQDRPFKYGSMTLGYTF